MDAGLIANLADDYFMAREARLALQKEVEKLEEQEKALKAQLMEGLQKSGALGISGQRCRVTLVTKNEPAVKDWNQLYNYIRENDAFDLLQKRLSAPAVRERWDEKEDVPGVGTFPVQTLSINKL